MPEVDKYKEMPAIQMDFPTENPTDNHQPIAVVVDISGSMTTTESGETKSNVKLAEELVNQIGLDPNMTDDYKSAADFLVMTFADNVIVQQDWIPLSQFARNIKLTAAGCTAFHDAVIQAINATRVRRNSYSATGIKCKRPQIFVFTDGCATDPERAAEAQTLCKEYVDEKRKVTLHIILLPGASSKEAKALCNNVKVYKIEDCTHGLPASLSFINSSLVEFSRLNPTDDNATLPLPDELKTTADNLTVDENGNRTVTDEEVWK